jgi:hypothetical protein
MKIAAFITINRCKATCFGHLLWPDLMYTNMCQQIGKEEV